MRQMSIAKQCGFTIIEIVVSITIFSTGLLVVLDTLNTTTAHSESSMSRVMAGETTSTLAPRLIEILSEASISHVDSSARINLVDDGISFSTDRFSSSNLRQCPSATCQYHTTQNLSVNDEKLTCGQEYREGLGLGLVSRGKNFPREISECPYDGTVLRQNCTLDGVKLFAARSNGQFVTRSGEAHWNTMLFIFPRSNDEGFCDLTVHELRISDLLAASVVGTNWTRWTADDLDFVDIFDFGTDGTTNGQPDGKAPTTIADCDANYERFVLLQNNENSQLVVFEKTLGMSSDGTYRRVEIELDLNTNTFGFHIEHRDSVGVEWQSTGSVTRSPKVLTNRLTEFVVSTEKSSPKDAVNNPLGISGPVVRIQVGTTRRKHVSQTLSYDHHIQTIKVFPKN